MGSSQGRGSGRAQRVGEGVAGSGGSSRAAGVPGSAPAAQWTAPARLPPVCLSHWTRLILAPPPGARAAATQPGRAPPLPSDVTTLHFSSDRGAGPPPGLGFCWGQPRPWRRRNPAWVSTWASLDFRLQQNQPWRSRTLAAQLELRLRRDPGSSALRKPQLTALTERGKGAAEQRAGSGSGGGWLGGWGTADRGTEGIHAAAQKIKKIPFDLSVQTSLLRPAICLLERMRLVFVPFPRFTQMLEGLTAAETCSGEEKTLWVLGENVKACNTCHL